MKKVVAVLLVLGAALVPMRLQAQESTTTRQMRRVAVVANDRGFSMTRQYYRGDLSRGRVEEFNVELSDSQMQMLVAVCDNDCSDVDISLYELNGREIASDRSYDDHPMVMVPSGHPGTHRVRVSMPGCSVSPCRYEFAVFNR
jgi:hypothetical protein